MSINSPFKLRRQLRKEREKQPLKEERSTPLKPVGYINGEFIYASITIKEKK